MFDRDIFDEARQEFLAHLRYAKGHSKTTCYAYNSDLGIWADWLQTANKDWQRARAADVELLFAVLTGGQLFGFFGIPAGIAGRGGHGGAAASR